MGECISFYLTIPSARLFSGEANRAISIASMNSYPVYTYKDLREELENWRFLDTWEGCASWRLERHFQIVLATDLS